jgi:cell division protein FtsW (lipid II flippase)
VLGFNLQPSEFAKLGIIITMAAILHDRPANTSLAQCSGDVSGCVALTMIF